MMIDSRSPSTDAEGERLSSTPPDPAPPPDAAVTADVAAATLDPGPVVLLVDASRAPDRAADTAIELATTWAQAGRRIVLADLHLEHPVLHERLGETNRDGVVDIFLYGASLARSARPVSGRGFYLIPAGTYAADSQAVLGHARWTKLLAGFRDADASLLLFAPADAAMLEMLAQWSTEAILLGGTAGEAEQPGVALPPGLAVRATLTPLAPESAAAPSPVEESPADSLSTVETPQPEHESAEASASAELADEEPPEAAESSESPADGAEPVRIAVVAPDRSTEGSEAAAPAGDLPVEEPPPALPAPQEPSRRRRPLALWLVLVALLLVAAGALLLYLFRPDLLQLGDPARPAAEAAGARAETPTAPAAPVAPAVPEGTALPYAVHVRAYRSLSTARDQVASEERRLGDQPVYISPELIQGILYYRLLAGLPSDSAAALRLRQRLLDAGAIDAEDAAGALDLIRYTPLAFRLGEFTTRREALARADALFELGIPSYLAVLPYSDGSERWLLYGGAFRDSMDAEGMRELLARAGLEAPLVERLGRPSDTTP